MWCYPDNGYDFCLDSTRHLDFGPFSASGKDFGVISKWERKGAGAAKRLSVMLMGNRKWMGQADVSIGYTERSRHSRATDLAVILVQNQPHKEIPVTLVLSP